MNKWLEGTDLMPRLHGPNGEDEDWLEDEEFDEDFEEEDLY